MGTDEIIQQLEQNLDLSKRAPLKDVLFEAFRNTIVLGNIPAGTQLNEKQISAALHISRTPIRAALDRLADAQVVERVAGTGVVVRGISTKDADEIYEIREALEVLSARKAARRMSEAELDDMRELIEHGEELNRAGDVSGVVENFNLFNDFIYDHARMPRLRDIVSQLQLYSRYFRDVALRLDERRDEAFREHWAIYDAMRARDEEAIGQAVTRHLMSSHDIVVEGMRARGFQ